MWECWSNTKNPSVYQGYLIITFEDTGRHRREDLREYLHDFRHVLTARVRSLSQPPPTSPSSDSEESSPFFWAADRWFWSKKCECSGIQGAVKVKTVSAQITVIGMEGKERGGWEEARGEIELYRRLEHSGFHVRARCTLGAFFSDSWWFYGFYPSSFSSSLFFSLSPKHLITTQWWALRHHLPAQSIHKLAPIKKMVSPPPLL